MPSYDKRSTEAMHSLQAPDLTPDPLPVETPRRDIEPVAGVGSPTVVQAEGGAISSPLTEPDYTSRAYWPAQEVESSDGIIVFQVEPIKTVNMQDANNEPVTFNYAEPV